MANHAQIGKNVAIHVGAKVESECIIEDSSFISLGAFIGANTALGRESFVGPNATLKDHLGVGNRAIVGMGSVVTKKVDDDKVVIGNPAKVLRNNVNKKVFEYSNVGNA